MSPLEPGEVQLAERLFDVLRANTLDAPGVTRASYGEGERYAHQRTAECARALGLEVRVDAADLFLDVIGNSPEEMAQVIKAEIPKWAKIIKDSGAKAD